MATSKVKKGLSPLLACVVLIALVLTVGILLSSSLSSMFQSEREKTKNIQACSHAGILIEDVICTDQTLKIVIQNSGNVPLSDFHVYAKISGNPYTNTTPVNYNTSLEPGESTILEASVSYQGNVETVKVYTGTCPGISAEVSNETISVTC